jgi:glutamyl-tRNA synthetase
MQLKGFLLSKSKINELMKSGEIKSWDDPRLATVQALRRRGFRPETLRELMVEIGAKPQDVQVPFQKLEDWNRKIIDPLAERIVFLKEPMELETKNAPELKARLARHPDFAGKGFKEYKLQKGKQLFWIEKEQAAALKPGETVQLKQAYSVKILKKNAKKIEAEFVSTEFKPRSTIVHWLLPKETVKAEIVMGNALVLKGVAEKELTRYKEGTPLQFERMGYVVVDGQGKNKTEVRFTQP